MPFNSSQISGLVGGQMAMFSNQAAYSQQVGGMAGTGPMPAGGGIQNPFPNAGAQIAGGMGMALPGMATGASVGGMMMGGTLGWLDPLTGMARGFAGGAGMAGQGFGQVAGGIGHAFATGGLRAGAGMMAGGLAGAAGMALPYALIGGAIRGVGENIYAGAQNISEVGAMTQHFGTQFGQPGAQPGGGMNRQVIKNIVGVLHDLVGEDVRTTMEDLKRLMDQSGQMGMLMGINNAQEFRNRFTKIVRQVRDISDVMGTSMAEAAPMFAQMRQMGLWTAQDVMGTAMAARVAGPAAGQMMAAMGQGAQMAHAMGGTMRAGAMMGRESFMNLGAAQRAGVLTQEDVMEFTGGVGGAAGQRMMAQRMTGIMGRFGQTSAGRLMMAGLGQTEGGVFTGGINQERLQRFLQGDISVGQLQQMGQRGAGTQEGAMSFFRQEGRLGQQLGAQGGLEAMTQIVQQIAETRFQGSEQARHQLFRQMLGVSNREAELLGRIADELPRIQDQRTREVEAHTRRVFDELERKQFRSWEGFRNAARGMMTQATRPLQEMGESLATSIGEATDRATMALTGQVAQIPMTQQERSRLLRGGALTADISEFNVEQFDIAGPTMGLPNIIRRMQAPGAARRGGMGMGLGAVAGGLLMPGGAALGALGGFGAPLLGAGEEMTPQRRAALTIGITDNMTRTEARTARSRAWMRANAPTMAGLGLKDTGKLTAMKSALSSVIGRHASELSETKKSDPTRYTEKIIGFLKAEPSLANIPDGELRDYLAVASQSYSEGSLAIDFRGDVLRSANIATSPEELATQQAALRDALASETEGTREKVLRIGAANVIGFLAAPFTGGLSFGLVAREHLGGPGAASRDLIEQALTGTGSEIFIEYMKGTIKQEEAVDILAQKEGAGRVMELIAGMTEEERLSHRDTVNQWRLSRAAQIQPETLERISAIAKRGPQTVAGVAGFEEIVRGFTAGTTGGVQRAFAGLERVAGRDLSARQLRRLRERGGPIGRQITALHRIRQLGPTLGEEETQDLVKELKGMGFDIERGGEVLQQQLKEGVTAKEMAGEEGVRERLARMTKTQMTEMRGVRGTAQQQMHTLLGTYADKNREFVDAVNHALGGEGRLGEAHRQLTGAKENSSAATPGFFEQVGTALGF